MRKFGMSVLMTCAMAAPVWGQYPVQFGSGELPPPAGYPILPAGVSDDGPPDRLPPLLSPNLPPRPPAWPPALSAVPAAPSAAAGDACGGCGYAFDPCYPCQRKQPKVHNEYWVRGEWLYWDLRGAPIPPLIVTGNPTLPLSGIPGGGNSTPLIGGPRDLGRFHGARLTLGQWFDCDGELGYEVSGFVLGREGSADFFDGTAARPVSVPFFGADGTAGVFDFGFPGRFNGSLGVRTATQLFGAESNLVARQYGDGCFSFDVLFGYRYLQLNERLDLLGMAQPVGATGSFLGAPLAPGAVVTTTDSFRARTEFHGAQLGGRLEARRGLFTGTWTGRAGIGANIHTLRVDGATVAGGTRAFGGVRALPGNFGRRTNTDFAFMSESGVELGVQVTKHVSLRVGYNVLFWSDVVRPGNVIDATLTRAQVPIDPTFNPAVSGTRPSAAFRTSDFLAHGLVVGALVDW